MKSIAALLCAVWAWQASPAAQSAAWLDQPIQNWNQPGAALPTGTAGTSDRDDAVARCKVTRPQTDAARAIAAAGWVPQAYLDRELIKGDVEIVAAVSGLDGACAPVHYNLFVFVAGSYAGALSPRAMSSGADASAGAVRFVGDGITAEFARYKAGDSNCCPSSRMAVRYHIERSGGRPVVVPLDAKTTRSY
jgi:hypothetical protein